MPQNIYRYRSNDTAYNYKIKSNFQRRWIVYKRIGLCFLSQITSFFNLRIFLYSHYIQQATILYANFNFIIYHLNIVKYVPLSSFAWPIRFIFHLRYYDYNISLLLGLIFILYLLSIFLLINLVRIFYISDNQLKWLII